MTEASLPPLIQAMQKPEFYPHPVTVPVELIQTHVSYVLLTGDYVYKVKKPVNFGFLDFSTLEKRQHFCQEELRLNQRGAAALYLEVLPISQVDSEYQLGDEGNAVEYTVKMRQFPQDALLSSLYDRGELTEALIQQLAVKVAAFHKTTPTNDYIRGFGAVGQIRQAFDENYEQTVGFIGGPQTQQQFDETQAYTDRFFGDRTSLFEQRVQQDKIRECHGDLHLRNIASWNNELWLFDCIEFNEPFRFVDVMYDVAYIVMDLDIRQRPDLRALFLNTYFEETGDWEGLQVLPIYVNRQTYVRAKVISFLLNDAGASAAEKQAASDTAAQYYRLAWEYTQPRKGQLVLMSGLSGSGKSTTARALAARTGAIHIRSDAVRKHLGGVALQERGDASLYTPEMTQKTYQRLLDLGVALASEGYTVILDAKYDRQEVRQEAIIQAKNHQLPLTLLHCTAPLEVLSDRLQKRTDDIADATVEVLAQQYFESFLDSEQSYVTTLESTQDITPQLDPIVQQIQSA
ncbi:MULTISPECIES: AAA family ATPase [unclassified Leptolyngbya]|uniref:bifunctional aminoglycoside phosphotransferase/ATP-binding protein n=1 Tax=unclassified Leptolyngbya TaxID=2650499 RepID=UPI001686E69C|nr:MULTISPECIES: AAA family ATPase [unclassified Leptolyngbya]MBD1913029.1 AAA family ATPase [Leptolyngbya sp. FACHB-8]MBD2154470.1 AAA family ATPase [Leptolyngbya sp. FACHB-16]